MQGTFVDLYFVLLRCRLLLIVLLQQFHHLVGHGLSYTTYDYGKLQSSATTIRRGETVRISVEVRNTGSRDGLETVHWYIRDPFCSISRPVKELKHFEKRLIRKGESETFVWELDPERDLAYVDAQGNPLLEAGTFHILVGGQQITLNLQ